ncbi:MAG: helix-turn-helix transcriptional regulator [Rhodanobacter sp.]
MPLTDAWEQPDSRCDLVHPSEFVVLGGGPGDLRASLVRHEPNGPCTQIAFTPADTIVARIFMGPCALSVKLGTQWISCGEVGEGCLHMSLAQQGVRTEWHATREALILHVPVRYWRENVACDLPVAMAAHELGTCVDAPLLQLAKMLFSAALDAHDPAFARHLVDAIVARIGVLFTQRIAPVAAMARNGLPRWRLQRVVSYVQEHVGDAISLADMAAAAGISAMHFAAQFRAATGLRPHHYLLQCRIQQAKVLLMDTTHSLIDIALSVGFRTQAHFTTVFKNFEYTTPMQWRRNRVQGMHRSQRQHTTLPNHPAISPFLSTQQEASNP